MLQDVHKRNEDAKTANYSADAELTTVGAISQPLVKIIFLNADFQ